MNTKTLIFIFGEISPKHLNHIIQKALNNGDHIKVIAELQDHLADLSYVMDKAILDDYRSHDLSVRKSAEQAEQILLDLRSKISGLFCHLENSLWVVNETNILHFKLLRLVDDINIVNNIIDVEKPGNIICVGFNENLSEVIQLIAKSNAIKFKYKYTSLTKDYMKYIGSKSKLLLSKLPTIKLTIYYLIQNILYVLKYINIRGKQKKKISDIKKIDVTFLGTDKKQSDIILQLYKTLKKEGTYNCKVLNLANSKLTEFLSEKGCVVDYLPNWQTRNTVVIEKKAQALFLSQAIKVFRSDEVKMLFRLDDINCWPLFSDDIARTVLFGCSYLVNVAEQSRNYFKSCQTDVVITPAEWNSTSRACVIAANSLGIKTISVQRGDITDYPGWREPIFSNWMTVNGESVKQALIKNGVSENKLFVTGDPRLDPWVTKTEEYFNHSTREKLDISNDKKLIAVMTNPINLNEKESHAEEYIGALMEISVQDPTLCFVIKLHPSEKSTDFYENIKSKMDATTVIIIKELDTPQLLFDSDAVITTISTTGDEAIFLNKPLIVVNLTNEEDFMPYANSEAAITIHHKEELRNGINAALYDTEKAVQLALGRRSYIKKHMFSNDGNSSYRFKELMPTLQNHTTNKVL